MPNTNTPSAPRATTNRINPDELTNQELLENVWIGKSTGNLFKAVEITMEEGVRLVTYTKATGESYKKPYATFMSRFRPATNDDLWGQIKATAAVDDGEDSSSLLTTVQPDHRHDLARIILYPDCREEILLVSIG